MKKFIISFILLAVGVGALIGGSVYASNMHKQYAPDYNNYRVLNAYYEYYTGNGYEISPPPEMREEYYSQGYIIKYPFFRQGESRVDLSQINHACSDYAFKIARIYNNKAKLDFTVENDNNKVLKIRLFGTGYPENGEPEELERIYYFDIDGVSADKRITFINRAEFIGY